MKFFNERRRFVIYILIVCAVPPFLMWLNTPTHEPGEQYIHARPEHLKWFSDAKVGLMITWSPVSLVGTEISWSRQATRPGEEGVGTVPVAMYDTLYKRFNPVRFNAEEWVRLAQDAGARYLVFITKHHDGFCMFDTRSTEFKITNSPFHRDVTAEIAAACHKYGMRLGFYYSPPDWRHPDYRTSHHERYIPYLHGQMEELCRNYGNVDLFWFDGLAWRVQDWDSINLFKMVRELQPGVLINNRAALAGDFHIYEQKMSEFNPNEAWEMCLPLGEQWSWKPDDRWKSADTCITDLVQCVGKGGNFLLNIGPPPDGAMHPEHIARLKAIGDWLKRYGQSIYGTRAGPFKPKDWGVSTYRDNMMYMHILDRSKLPPKFVSLPYTILDSAVLTGGTVEVTLEKTATSISVSPTDANEIDIIVRLTLDGPVAKISPRD